MKRMLFATLATAAALAGGQALVPSPAAAMDDAGGDAGTAAKCPLVWDDFYESFVCDDEDEAAGGGGSSSGSGGGAGSGAGTPGGSSAPGSGGGAGTRPGPSRGPGDGGIRLPGYFDESAARGRLRDDREACFGIGRDIQRADRDEDDVQRHHGRVGRAGGKEHRSRWNKRGCDKTLVGGD